VNKLNIEKIELIKPEPDDLIVATIPRGANIQEFKDVKKMLAEVFPDRVLVIIPSDIDIKTLGVDDLRQIGLQKIKGEN